MGTLSASVLSRLLRLAIAHMPNHPCRALPQTGSTAKHTAHLQPERGVQKTSWGRERGQSSPTAGMGVEGGAPLTLNQVRGISRDHDKSLAWASMGMTIGLMPRVHRQRAVRSWPHWEQTASTRWSRGCKDRKVTDLLGTRGQRDWGVGEGECARGPGANQGVLSDQLEKHYLSGS